MKRLLVGESNREDVFDLVDPTSFVEVEFEAAVVKALSYLLPAYCCGVFAGGFVLEGERRVADLAMIHTSLSHWFVVEVELAGHSLEHHVLPQVRCFRYGEPDQSCVTGLVNAFLNINREDAKRVLCDLPRYVAVVGNIKDEKWSTALTALDTQYLTLSIFRSRSGVPAYELDGDLVARTQSLGFAQFSAVDNCLRIHSRCGLRAGQVVIYDQFGNPATWTVREMSGLFWICKNYGPPLLAHESYVQLIRTSDDRVALRPSTVRQQGASE